MPRLLRDVPARPHELLPALAAAWEGSGPAVRPVPDGAPRSPRSEVPDDVVLVVPTSGSTGEPRDVLLSADALRASAAATADRLGGPAQWLLALPVHHVAGVQVLVRSLLAGTTPVVLGPGPFRPQGFVEAVRTLRGDRRYVSVVPTQLGRLLDDEAAIAALAGLDAVLVGGAGVPGALRERARAAGVRLVVTYGMSETCGGCVYDGRPLDGVGVRLDDDGRVMLSGPVLATGYRDRPDLDAEAFVRVDGVRSLRTADLGTLDAGVLHVLGRADDVIVTGGEKVAPAAVEAVLATLPQVRESCVVALGDERWGAAVVALVVPGRDGGPDLATLRGVVGAALGRAAAPRHLVVLPTLPLRGPGKVDRRAATALARLALGDPPRPDRVILDHVPHPDGGPDGHQS